MSEISTLAPISEAIRNFRNNKKNHVGFTGTQDLHWVNKERKKKLADALRLLHQKGYHTFHHGDCVGADELASQMAEIIGFAIHIHPPVNNSKRAFCAGFVFPPKKYLARNKDIVEGTELLIALPKDPSKEELRSGTWSTVRYARKIGKRVYIL